MPKRVLSRRNRGPSQETPDISSDSEDEHENTVKAPKTKPNRKRGPKKPVKQTVVHVEKEDIDDEISSDEEQSIELIFEACKNKQSTNDVAQQWIRDYKKNKGELLMQIIYFFMQTCGQSADECLDQIDETQEIDEEKVGEIVANIVEHIEENVVEFPLSSKAQKFKSFEKNFKLFWNIIGEFGYNLDGIEVIIEYATLFSSASVTQIRKVGAIAGMELGLGLIKAAKTLRKQIQSMSGKKKSKEAKRLTNEYHNQLREIDEDFLVDLAEGIFLHRLKDSDDDVRKHVFEVMGEWIVEYPDMFLSSHYMKYVNMFLRDGSAEVRKACLDGLSKIVLNCEDTNSLLNQLPNSVPSVIDLATEDKDIKVRTSGLQLCLHILQNSDLKELIIKEAEYSFKMERALFTDNIHHRKIAAECIIACISEPDEQLNDAKKKKIHKIVEIVDTIVMNFEEGFEKEELFADGVGNLHVAEFGPMTEWELLVDMLKKEPAQNNYDEDLREHVARFFAYSACFAIGTKVKTFEKSECKKKTEQKLRDKHQKTLNNLLSDELPGLLSKFSTDESMIPHLLKLAALIESSAFEDKSQVLEDFLKVLVKIFRNEEKHPILSAVVDVFENLLNEDSPPQIREKAEFHYNGLMEDCIQSTSDKLETINNEDMGEEIALRRVLSRLSAICPRDYAMDSSLIRSNVELWDILSQIIEVRCNFTDLMNSQTTDRAWDPSVAVCAMRCLTCIFEQNMVLYRLAVAEAGVDHTQLRNVQKDIDNASPELIKMRDGILSVGQLALDSLPVNIENLDPLRHESAIEVFEELEEAQEQYVSAYLENVRNQAFMSIVSLLSDCSFKLKDTMFDGLEADPTDVSKALIQHFLDSMAKHEDGVIMKRIALRQTNKERMKVEAEEDTNEKIEQLKHLDENIVRLTSLLEDEDEKIFHRLLQPFIRCLDLNSTRAEYVDLMAHCVWYAEAESGDNVKLVIVDMMKNLRIENEVCYFDVVQRSLQSLYEKFLRDDAAFRFREFETQDGEEEIDISKNPANEVFSRVYRIAETLSKTTLGTINRTKMTAELRKGCINFLHEAAQYALHPERFPEKLEREGNDKLSDIPGPYCTLPYFDIVGFFATRLHVKDRSLANEMIIESVIPDCSDDIQATYNTQSALGPEERIDEWKSFFGFMDKLQNKHIQGKHVPEKVKLRARVEIAKPKRKTVRKPKAKKAVGTKKRKQTPKKKTTPTKKRKRTILDESSDEDEDDASFTAEVQLTQDSQGWVRKRPKYSRKTQQAAPSSYMDVDSDEDFDDEDVIETNTKAKKPVKPIKKSNAKKRVVATPRKRVSTPSPVTTSSDDEEDETSSAPSTTPPKKTRKNNKPTTTTTTTTKPIEQPIEPESESESEEVNEEPPVKRSKISEQEEEEIVEEVVEEEEEELEKESPKIDDGILDEELDMDLDLEDEFEGELGPMEPMSQTPMTESQLELAAELEGMFE